MASGYENPANAGVRYRCLNPMRYLERRGFVAEIYDPRAAERHDLIVCQTLESFSPSNAAQDAS